jgi:hypothetical protein
MNSRAAYLPALPPPLIVPPLLAPLIVPLVAPSLMEPSVPVLVPLLPFAALVPLVAFPLSPGVLVLGLPLPLMVPLVEPLDMVLLPDWVGEVLYVVCAELYCAIASPAVPSSKAPARPKIFVVIMRSPDWAATFAVRCFDQMPDCAAGLW